jgi:hypothetical protein
MNSKTRLYLHCAIEGHQSQETTIATRSAYLLSFPMAVSLQLLTDHGGDDLICEDLHNLRRRIR